jgi:hypothetical protein
MTSDTSLIAFKAISTFTSELVESFSKYQRSLKLYGRLINKTTISHTQSIQKHIDTFKIFCISNREAIIQRDHSKLQTNKIEFSDRVYVDMDDIFRRADKETLSVIWQHLLYISSLVDPAGRAKEILKENLSNGKSEKNETDFLTNLFDKVEAHVDPNANPMEAVSSIMKSGIFTDLIGGMNSGVSNGTLDIGKLMGAVQGMVAKMGEKTGGDSQANNALNMITSLMGGMGGMGSDSNSTSLSASQPNLNAIMAGLMSSMNTQSDTKSDTQKIAIVESVNQLD